MSDNEDSYSNNSDEEDDDDDEEDTHSIIPIKIAPQSIKDTTNIVYEDEDDAEADEDYDENEDEDDDDDEVEEDDADEVDSKVGGKTPNIIVNQDASNYVSDDDDDDDTYDDNYLQKFDSEITKNYINEFHPECLHHNYDEIALMSLVTRDNHNIIIDAFHKTIPTLTKYEKARILGQRASQIESGAKPLVAVPKHIVEGYLIAELELKQKRIPFIIRRPIPGGGCEYWNIKDLEDISF